MWLKAMSRTIIMQGFMVATITAIEKHTLVLDWMTTLIVA